MKWFESYKTQKGASIQRRPLKKNIVLVWRDWFYNTFLSTPIFLFWQYNRHVNAIAKETNCHYHDKKTILDYNNIHNQFLFSS